MTRSTLTPVADRWIPSRNRSQWRRRITVLSLAALAALVAQLPWLTILGADGAGKPNLVFIFADDQCYETIGALGQTDIDTPHLDRLAARGTTFTRAYNMGSWSGAVCVASRAMLITGRHLWDAQRIYDRTDEQRQAGVLWPQLLEQAGYDTYFTGKWHIRTGAGQAFAVAQNVRGGMPATVASAYNRPLQGQPDRWSPFDRSLGGFWQGGTHWSEVVADDADEFFERAGNREKPFFMYLAFNAPHDPRQSPQAYVDKYPPDRIQVPESYLPEYPYKDAIGCGPGLRDEKLGPFPRTERAVKVHRGEYYAMIEHMDAQIGRILDAVEKSGQADNTWIFFTADHGLAVGHHGLFGKQNMYEHSVRVPFLVAGPGVAQGQQIAAPIYLQDVMPTCLELAGAVRPDHVWFHSLLPLLRGQTDRSAYEATYGAYLNLQRSVTVDGYKLILYPRAQRARLYDLNRDPYELEDLADDPQQAPKMKELLAQLVALQQQLDDSLDLKGTFAQLE